jgi:hypothetical protein
MHIIVAALFGWGLFVGYQLYRENSANSDRAVANCIEEHNRTAAGSDGRDAVVIAAICAHNRPAGQ